MPLGLPAPGVVRTPANFEAPIKTFVDNLETTTNAAVSTANAAAATAGQKYTKPAQGIPVTDLASGAASVVVRRPVAGVWQVRGTTSTVLTVIWFRPLSTDPAIPIGGADGAIINHDILLQP